MESVASARIWPQLPAELSERIASFLGPNVIACTLRLVNKAAAKQFSGPQHTTIRLSQPVPPHAFTHHWSASGATRGLPYSQRLKLLCLTGASGCILNMEVALVSAGCLLREEVFQAAAAAGQRAMCEWLLQRGCPHRWALAVAAEAGRRDMCEWLLGQGDSFVDSSVSSNFVILETAARGGHVGLMEWLMRTHPDRLSLPKDRFKRTELLANVAEGCDLATLQRLHRELLGAPQEGGGGSGQEQGLLQFWGPCLLAAAARSPTPDWRAKVGWLEGRGCEKTKDACTAAAACPDALERLTWLRQGGYPTEPGAAQAAARAGNLAALQYLHAEGVEVQCAETAAASKGHLSVVAWLAEAPGVGVDFREWLFSTAAQSGNIDLLAWLRERECPWSEFTFHEATDAGNEAALEWLVERGCPMGVDGGPYLAAFRNRDLTILRCLARLGCPWGQKGWVFGHALDYSWGAGEYAVVMLWTLVVAGCPVDWEAAQAAVVSMWEEGHVKAQLLAVLAEGRARRRG